jgi:hypothetical protein
VGLVPGGGGVALGAVKEEALANRRWAKTCQHVSHPVLEGKPNANHVRARISYSRTQQLHNMDIITQCSK